jgi:hypothetical protein
MITNKRTDDYWVNILGVGVQVFSNPLKALVHMITHELEPGGDVLQVGEMYCEIGLSFFRVSGISIWSGPKNEMRPIFQFLKMYGVLTDIKNLLIFDLCSMIVTNWVDLSRTGEIFKEENRLNAALMVAAGISNPIEYRLGFEASYPDLLAAIELVGEGETLLNLLVPRNCKYCKHGKHQAVSVGNRHGITTTFCERFETVVIHPKTPDCDTKVDWVSIYS